MDGPPTQSRHEDLLYSMRLQMDHLTKAQRENARATETSMSWKRDSLEGLKRDSNRHPCRSDTIGGPEDHKTQKVWISHVTPTGNHP